MFTTKNAPELFRLLPEKIKLEVLKEECLKVYKKEMELEEDMVKCGYKSYTMLWFDHSLDTPIHELEESYRNLLQMIDIFQLSEEGKTTIYYWAKIKRKELKLNDNLFNIFPILLHDKYENINEQINKQNSI